jgi:hypothetical protein
MSVGTAMIAAQPVTFLVMMFILLPWMARLVSKMLVTRSRSPSVRSAARSA